VLPPSPELHFWIWYHTDEFGKHRRSSWHMTEAQAAHYKDAVKVEGSLERRTQHSRTKEGALTTPREIPLAS